MEDNNRIVKVYSNSSKKARLKRNKNKFQRIWDAEKQTYVKVRKAKYPVRTTTKKPAEDIEVKLEALKRRKTVKKPKSVPVKAQVAKPETKQNARKEPARVHGKITSTAKVVNLHRIGGVDYVWDTNTLRYKRAA